MTREGQDGINSDAAGMNHSISVVAYYISGRFAWTQAEIDMFPNSVHVRIATQSSVRDGHVIDCENGDATPAQAAQWAHQRRVDGFAYPIVYCSISAQPAVIAAFNAINEPLPGWWLAHYDNLDVLPAGALGKQYADPGPLDRSIWADYIPGVDGVQGGGTTTPPSSPPVNVISAGTVLQLGSTGQAVKELQTTLNTQYPSYSKLVVDGNYGPATETVVKEFQTRAMLVSDGVAGPKTLAALHLINSAPAPTPSVSVLKEGSTGNAVRTLQSALNTQYPAYSHLTVDGNFGPATLAVVKEFQQRAGLSVDGIVGPATLKALHIS